MPLVVVPCLTRGIPQGGLRPTFVQLSPSPGSLLLTPGLIGFPFLARLPSISLVWSDLFRGEKKPKSIFTMPEIETLDDEVFFCLICNLFSFVFGIFFSLPSSYNVAILSVRVLSVRYVSRQYQSLISIYIINKKQQKPMDWCWLA